MIDVKITSNPITSFLCFMGKFSLEITVIHYIIFLPVIKMLLDSISKYQKMTDIVQKYILFIVLLVVTDISVYILSKTKLFSVIKGCFR